MDTEGDTMAMSICRIAGIWTAAIQQGGRLLRESFATRAEAIAWLREVLAGEYVESHGIGVWFDDVEVAHA